ncbi:MAG: PIN domain-containing protein [Cellulomonadaceae bacterium]|jgi:predicted nucleic acid-binding protein|nr:PIN domain-containing protein [Cellulomonadaceae bacterium]
MIVLDASVLVAFTNRHDKHHEKAIDVLSSDVEFGSHRLTVAEFLVLPARHGRARMAWDFLTRDDTAGGMGVRVLHDRDVAGTPWPIHLAELRAQSGLKLPDAVVLATAVAYSARLASFDARMQSSAQAIGILYEV